MTAYYALWSFVDRSGQDYLEASEAEDYTGMSSDLEEDVGLFSEIHLR